MKSTIQFKFPELFGARNLGVNVGSGWDKILDDLCQGIVTHCIDNDITCPLILQIKEKFAGLRFYLEYETDEISKLIRTAEALSFKTCESCGTTDDVEQRGNYWLVTRCSECFTMEKK